MRILRRVKLEYMNIQSSFLLVYKKKFCVDFLISFVIRRVKLNSVLFIQRTCYLIKRVHLDNLTWM